MYREVQDRVRVGYDEWQRMYQSLKQKLGDWDLYWEVFDPRLKSDFCAGSLADVSLTFIETWKKV
jgi:hypothetical protein